MKGVVFINQVTGYLMKDVINDFCKEYDDIALIAGRISDTGPGLDPKVRVSMICPYRKESPMRRLLSWLWATIQATIIINIKYRKHHIFITSNPPTLAFLPLFCSNRYSVLVYDIYPDGLIAGGFLRKSSFISRIWAKRNREYFKKAANIFTLTESMADTLSKYIEKDRIKVIPPWSMFDKSSKIEKQNNIFIDQHDLKGKFIVMYSGNIGLGHSVESIVEVARILSKGKDIIFVIIGEGWNKPMIEQKVKDYHLTNCLILPYQPADKLNYSLSAADLGVVSVSAAGSRVCAPSKTYNLVSLNIPLLAIADHDTELALVVESNNIGSVFKNDQFEEMADYILDLKNNQIDLHNMIDNISKCSEKYTRANAKDYLRYFNNN